MKIKISLIAVLLLSSMGLFSQELLTKEDAAQRALEYNYGILIAKNKVNIAANNASIFNSGYLPQLTLNAGANYSNKDNEFTTHDNTSTEINGAVAKTYNASLGLDYTLFDGLGRSYNYKKLQENHNLSELEAKAIIENSLLQLFSIYFEVARLTEDQNNIKTSLEISKDRLKRATYAFEYGQQNKLQVLNAEVDVNNDSIQLINLLRLLSNSKRDLNLILGRRITTNFSVDTELSFELIYVLDDLIEKSKQQNIAMQQVNQNIKISDFELKMVKSDYLPIVRLSSSYGFNKADNDATFNYAETQNKGLNAGLSLQWNIFDGGNNKTRVQNAQIFNENLTIEKERISLELERDVSNALEVYNNALFILSSEEKNVETNRRNFQRTEEQFNLGQVSSIEFRQAQVNLLRALSNMNQSKYDAKNAELRILQLTGDLLNSPF